MNSLQHRKSEFKKFCYQIGFKPLQIKLLSENITSNYKLHIEPKIDQSTGKVKTYLDGTEKIRTIRNPSKLLKVVQSRILKNILNSIPLSENVHGGVKNRSNITNAKPHQGKKFKFCTDLKDFYPSIHPKRVYNTFIKLGYSNHFSHWLTVLTTTDNQLPQGAPTSTYVSNLIFSEIDNKLLDFCKINSITHTRYIDDLTFSSQKDFEHLIPEILKTIIEEGFKISYRKTDYGGNQTITGIEVLPNKIDAPTRILEKSRIEIELNSASKPNTNYVNNIRKTNLKKPSVMTNKTKAVKDFDTLKVFREIKTKISEEIKGMTFEELNAYLEKNKLKIENQ